MLKEHELRVALVQAQRAANCCTTFCRVGSSIEDGRYRILHTGISSGDSDTQTVYAPAVLALNDVQLEPRFAAWLVALHKRQRVDLNEGKP